ncbi:MAG: hypothetical protein KGL39_12255 [Patescibacteria group bacterium]|nr:hypothetical protein [Patescibacteria group bacterium]
MFETGNRCHRTKCPHEHIQHCPLYIGMHIAGGPSCWPKNGKLEEKGCAVDQGADYDKLVAKFAAAHPRDYAECQFMEAAHESKEQRRRNLVVNGIH